MAEQLINSVSSVIAMSAGLDHAATTLTVASGAVFPATGNFRVWVDQEIMLCTARSGNDLTVTRGQEGTTATAHANGATVQGGATAGGIAQYVTDHASSGSGLAWIYVPASGWYQTAGGSLMADDAVCRRVFWSGGGNSANAMERQLWLPAGTYTLGFKKDAHTDRAIISMRLDGTEFHSEDCYHADPETITDLVITGITVTGGPLHLLQFVANGHNGSSTGYQMVIWPMMFQQTA